MSVEKILVVDDEESMREFLSETLRRKKADVTSAADGKEALQRIAEQTFDIIITDMKMTGATGFDILKAVKESSPHTAVIVITGFGSIENAVEAMRLGAFTYIIKPFSKDTIEALVEKAADHIKLVNENNHFRRESLGTSDRIIAESPKMKALMKNLVKIAKSGANVMITGESGTGKEEIARAIFALSARSCQPYIKVNCPAIPETLIESEFFGHEKGAFTGAHQKRIGRFELADRGTLLLDEVTEVPILLQPKLLRAIQEQEFERVGGSRPVKVDVRIISTSNRNIESAIRDMVLREDLYYRLNVIPLEIAPLRERKEDIIPLAELFIQRGSAQYGCEMKVLSKGAKEALLAYSWPGNVRELSNVIERALVMVEKKTITESDLGLHRQ